VRSLSALGPPPVAGVYPRLLFLFRKLRPATATLQYQNGPARVLLRHLKSARPLVGCVVSRPGHGSTGWDSGAERSEVRL
jgi:hypothetical protein